MTYYRYLEMLATADATTSDEELFTIAGQVMESWQDVITIRKRFYSEVGKALNGIIALQFLQTETLLDMMECSDLYEDTPWSQFRFHPKALNENQFKEAKRNIITTALSLSDEQADNFFRIYDRYEEECNALLGEEYDLIALYAGDARDFTPALAKRLGNDLMHLIEREGRLKEKYVTEMRNAVGQRLAASFLLWEDYYSVVSKMYAWADAP